jgi:hypothetical protein
MRPSRRIDRVPFLVGHGCATEDGEPADVGEPAVVDPQQPDQFRSGQPFQQAGGALTPGPFLVA